jgi:hypothetical protein
MAFVFTLPRKIKGLSSAFVERNQKTGAIIAVFERNARLFHVLLSCLVVYFILFLVSRGHYVLFILIPDIVRILFSNLFMKEWGVYSNKAKQYGTPPHGHFFPVQNKMRSWKKNHKKQTSSQVKC